MYDRTEQILEGYPIDFTGNMKGRGFSICTDAQGSYRLMEYSGSVHRLELLEQLLAHLDRHGIICEQLVRTKENELVKQGKVSDYYLRTYFYGYEKQGSGHKMCPASCEASHRIGAVGACRG